METANQDFNKLIEKSKNILFVTPPDPSIDSLASAFALSKLITKKDGKETAVFHRQPIPEKISFLEKPEKIINDLEGARDFLLIFNTEKNRIIKTESEEKEGQFIVRVTPEKGSIDPRDFSFVPAKFKYDLMITLGVKSLESLGEIYTKNSDLFFEVPKINIDHNSANENFGQLNIIDFAASSCAEIIAEMLLENNEKDVDETLAQSLLTGIVAATESFQKPTTSPKSMVLAAKLMKHKAEQSTIIRHLYKAKTLSFMKLWGKIMAHLKWKKDYRMAWSVVSAEDFIQSHASEQDIPLVLEEIEKNFSQGQIFAIVYSDGNSNIKARIRIANEKIRQKISDIFEIEPVNQASTITVKLGEESLSEAEKKLLQKIEEADNA